MISFPLARTDLIAHCKTLVGSYPDDPAMTAYLNYVISLLTASNEATFSA
jgi:hypothetical protein